MYCKKHETSIATLQCSVCGDNFCDLCGNGSDPFVCTSCSENDTTSVDDLTVGNDFNIVDIDENETIENELIESNFDNFNGTLADDILNDILGSITIPEKSKVNFDPSDILSQIEAGLEAERSIQDKTFVNEVVSEVVSEFISEEVVDGHIVSDTTRDFSEPDTHKIVLTKEPLDEEKSNVEHEIELEMEQEIETVSKIDTLKSKFSSTKDLTMEKINNIDMSSTKEKASVLSEETKAKASKLSGEAKEQASKLSEEAKVKSVAAAAFTVDTAKKVKTKASEKMASNKTNLDETISKIQQANVNGEYDELLSKFNTRYGQGAKEDDDGTHFALPLKINNFLYFLCSLIPGVAQFYLGLTKRGTTLLVTASVFLFVTMTPSLYFITSILSFADAYKLRNIYYRGGVIEDSNKDITSFLKNKYVILIIIATVVINMFRAIFIV